LFLNDAAVLLLQPVKWHESDECEKCSSPFFWNLKLMWEAKSLGGRQVNTSVILLMFVRMLMMITTLFSNDFLNEQLLICLREMHVMTVVL